MTSIRPPAVAGRFYTADRDALRTQVDAFLAGGIAPAHPGVPRAVIGPHAGYTFSGPIAGTAFAMLAPLGHDLRRAIVLGPSHHIEFEGVATTGYSKMRTPLGDVQVDRQGVATAEAFDFVSELEAAHDKEHSLETHFPFLQRISPDVMVVPLVTGRVSPSKLAELLTTLWDADTVLCVSSDLSHFENHASATAHDASTSLRIRELDASIGPRDACGATAIGGLLALARAIGLTCEVVDVRNSGDTAGDRDRVVGYGAYGFWEQE